MRTHRNLLVALTIVFVLLALAACAKKDVTKPGQAVNLTGDPVAGQVVYDGYCKSCHGAAGSGGVTNAGSDDGTIPELKPIDMDFSTALAMDLVIEHGSTPEGTPSSKMPAFGDEGRLKPQQIADVIAYVLGLNK